MSVAAVLIQEFVGNLVNPVLLLGLGMAIDVLPCLCRYIFFSLHTLEG